METSETTTPLPSSWQPSTPEQFSPGHWVHSPSTVHPPAWQTPRHDDDQLARDAMRPDAQLARESVRPDAQLARESVRPDPQLARESMGPNERQTTRSGGRDLPLFKMQRQRKPQYWQFIHLSATRTAWESTAPLSNADAEFAWCMECREELGFTTGNSAVAHHMITKHPDKIKEFKRRREQDELAARNRRLGAADLDLESPTPKRKKTVISPADQVKLNKLVAVWIARNMRPISLVEDKGFSEMFDFAGELGNIELKMPKRAETRKVIQDTAATLRDRLEKRISQDCEYFSVSTDLWTDKSLRSYIGLTLHYVCDQFASYSWVLGVSHFPGKHDNGRIATALDGLLGKWRLEKTMCALLLRDGAANAVAAARNLQVPDMSCIAHSIHLVVGGAVVRKPQGKRTPSQSLRASGRATPLAADGAEPSVDMEALMDAEGTAEILEEMREEVSEQVQAFLLANARAADQEAMASVREVVARFRALAVYCHRSSKAKHRLCEIEIKLKLPPLQLVVDCPTRWDSTWEMLYRFEQLRRPLKDFKDYLKTADGIDEFPDHQRIPTLTKRDWLFARCMRKLLDIFAGVSSVLGGDKYPTLIMVIPCLKLIEQDLQDTNVFAKIIKETPAEPYVRDVVATMHRVRRAILQLFLDRFRALKTDLWWIPVLDPRTSDWSFHDDPAFARAQLLDALIHISDQSRPSTPVTPDDQVFSPHVATPQKLGDRVMARLYGTNKEVNSPASSAPQLSHTDDMRAECENEVERYLRRAKLTTNPKTSALQWWRENGDLFPRMRKLAQKWLGCVATSVPCERAFSVAGNVVTARRCKLKPELVEDLLFISQNYQ